MNVQEIMSQSVRTCSVDDQLTSAAQLMWDNDCGCVPVVEDGKLAGMLTDRDVCMAAYTQGRSLSEIPVSSAMASSPVSIGQGDSLDEALAQLKQNGIRRLPVVDDEDHVVGILSMADVIRCCNETRGKKGVSGNAIAETLGSICESRTIAARDSRIGPRQMTDQE